MAAGVAQRCGMQHHLPRDGDLGRHVGQPELHGLVVDDLGAEGLALAGIGARRFERGAGHADRLGRDSDAADRQIGQRHPVALALLAQHGVGADGAILEGDLAGVGRFLPQFLLDRGDAIAGRLGRHDEAGDAALGRAPGSVTAKTSAMSAVRPEVMNCFTPFSTQPLPRRSARVLRFEASEPACGSVRQKAPSTSPLRQRLQPLLLLLGRAVGQQRRAVGRVVDAHHRRQPAVGRRDLLQRQHVGHHVGAGAAPFGRHASCP